MLRLGNDAQQHVNIRDVLVANMFEHSLLPDHAFGTGSYIHNTYVRQLDLSFDNFAAN